MKYLDENGVKALWSKIKDTMSSLYLSVSGGTVTGDLNVNGNLYGYFNNSKQADKNKTSQILFADSKSYGDNSTILGNYNTIGIRNTDVDSNIYPYIKFSVVNTLQLDQYNSGLCYGIPLSPGDSTVYTLNGSTTGFTNDSNFFGILVVLPESSLLSKDIPKGLLIDSNYRIQSEIITIQSINKKTVNSTIYYEVFITALKSTTQITLDYTNQLWLVCPTKTSVSTYAGDNTTVAGQQIAAQSQRSFIEGYYNISSGLYQMMIANNSASIGNTAYILGQNSVINSNNTLIFGINSYAKHNNTCLLGTGLVTDASYQTVIGRYNTPTTAIFAIGNGSSFTNRSNCFEVDSQGNVIGKTFSGSADMLDNYHAEQLMYRTIATRENCPGILCTTNVKSTLNRMIQIHIYGSSYLKSDVPINTYIQFYNYAQQEKIIAPGTVHLGHDFGNIYTFVYNGYICFWFKPNYNYQVFNIKASQSVSATSKTLQENCLTLVEELALPNTDPTYSREVIITPRLNAFTDSNVASADKLKTSRELWGQSFDGTGNIYGNLLLMDSPQEQAKAGMSYAAEAGTLHGFIGFENSGAGIVLGWGQYEGNQGSVTTDNNTSLVINQDHIKYKGNEIYHKGNLDLATPSTDGLMSKDDKIKLDNLLNLMQGYEGSLDDIFAYGIQWTYGQDDPHCTRIGNMTMHKTLPIQSQLKGCIAQGKNIMYYLGEDTWRARNEPILVKTSFTVNSNSITFTNTVQADFIDKQNTIDKYWLMSGNCYLGLYNIDTGSVDYLEPTSVDVTDNTIQFKESIATEQLSSYSTTDIYIGSNLSGYDGEVVVDTPDFYIKSIPGNTPKVYISTIQVDGKYYHQKRSLMSAYRVTVLNTVPTNMGYLSTLPVNSAVSIVNTSTYCRGGNNSSTYDSYLTSDIFRTQLGKPRTALSRTIARSYARKNNKELLSYIQYKNIIYWLWVIEYASFYSQEAYNSSLTSEGYKQGGFGTGITSMGYWGDYNNYYPLTPCGYGNKLGNKGGIIDVIIPQFSYKDEGGATGIQLAQTFKMPRWRCFDNFFGDIFTNVDGVIIQGDAEGNPKNVYATDNPSDYGDTDTYKEKMPIVGHQINQAGYIKELNLGTTAQIIPSVIGGSATTGKTDYNYVGDLNNTLRALWVGGHAVGGSPAGVGYFNSSYGVSTSNANAGFYTIKEL